MLLNSFEMSAKELPQFAELGVMLELRQNDRTR